MDMGTQLLTVFFAIICGVVVSAYLNKKTKQDAKYFVLICMWFIFFMFVSWVASKLAELMI